MYSLIAAHNTNTYMKLKFEQYIISSRKNQKERLPRMTAKIEARRPKVKANGAAIIIA